MLTNRIADSLKIIHEHPFHPQKVTVWCSMTCERIIDLYCIEDDNRRTVTGVVDSYRKSIKGYLLPEIEDLNMYDVVSARWGNSAHRKWQLKWSKQFSIEPLINPFVFLPLRIFKRKSLYLYTLSCLRN